MMKWIFMFAILGAGAAGCSETESTAGQRQEDALRDPFNYSPYGEDVNVSGGGTADFRKDAFKRDVNSVFNP